MTTPTRATGTPPQEARTTLATSGDLSQDAPLLYLREWLAIGPPWGRVLMVHGIGEHSGRYERTGRLLSNAGLDVQAFDLRGHGLSGGRRVYIRRWSDYLDDVEGRLAALRRPRLPTVLLGHSMGALIALTYACSNRPSPDLLVLSAPPLKALVPGWQRALAPAMSRLVPNMVIANPIRGEQLSTDPNVAAGYFSDPLVQPRSTARLGAELFWAMKQVPLEMDRLHIPTLVIHGGDDTLVPTVGSEPLTSVPVVDRRVLPGLRHETLNEPEGPEVVAGIVVWLRAHV